MEQSNEAKKETIQKRSVFVYLFYLNKHVRWKDEKENEYTIM